MISQTNAKGLRGISKTILLAIISFVVTIGIFSATAFADLATQYNVEIVVDGVSSIVTTNDTQATEILSQANITVEDSDKLDLSGFTAGKGGVIVVDKQHDVNVEFDGVINTYRVYADTVGDAFDEIGLTVNEKDKVNYSLEDAVIDGMVISIQAAKSVSLTVDGATTKYAIYQGTVKDLLELAKVELGKDDYTDLALTDELTEDMNVSVHRVTYGDVTEKEESAYGTTKVDDDTMYKGTTKVYSEGVKGEDEVTYKVKYIDGKEASREETSRKNLKAAVNEVVYVGTKEYEGKADISSNGVESYNGMVLGQVISGRYTHYCACATCNGNSRGITTSGRQIQNGMENPYYIACNWLPLGSVISVDGTLYTVVDRGGSGLSSTGRIDIFTPEGHAECYRLGTGSCSIELVRFGW